MPDMAITDRAILALEEAGFVVTGGDGSFVWMSHPDHEDEIAVAPGEEYPRIPEDG